MRIIRSIFLCLSEREIPLKRSFVLSGPKHTVSYQFGYFKAQPIFFSFDTYQIGLQPEWFCHAYYVYFVTMLDDDRRMVYVGMTGDRKHWMARSPFYRMAGHFNQLSASTENQVIKGIREYCNIDDIDQAGLVRKLEELKITYHAYPLAPFEFGVSKEEHTPLRIAAACSTTAFSSFIHAIRGRAWSIKARIASRFG